MTETRCGVCRHRDLALIESRLHAGEPNARIARAFGLSRWQVDRHKAEHLPTAAVVDVAEPEHVRELRDLDGRLVSLEALLTAVLDQALKGGKVSNLVSLAREVRMVVVDLARLRGELAETRPVQVNLLQVPEYRLVMNRLLESLTDYPEARYRAAAALASIEEGEE